MSFDDLLRHTLVIKRNVATGATDEYGQPVATTSTLATVAGLIQPRKAQEVALLSQAGAVASTHVGFMYPLAGLGTDCWIELDGVRYDVTGIHDAAGQAHHLQLDLRAVV